MAVKVPKKQVLTHEELASFMKEVNIMRYALLEPYSSSELFLSKIFCPHIALFMGATTTSFTKVIESNGESISGNIMIGKKSVGNSLLILEQ